MVEQSTVSVGCTAWDALWILVHALKSGSVVAIVLCHQVAFILECPTRRAVIPRWYNVDHRSSADIADGTRDVVLMYVWQGGSSIPFIL